MQQGTSILVIKMSSLGDHFHALPAVHMLKEAWGATVDWVTQPEYVELVKCFSDVDHVISFPRRNVLKEGWGFVRTLRRERYDYVVDLQGLLKSAVVARLARGAKTIGPSYAREGANLFYSAIAGKKNKNRHAVDEALDVVDVLGLERTAPCFPLSFPHRAAEASAPRIAMIPCSRWPTKNWPVEHFVEVGNAMKAEVNASVFLAGAPADREVCDHMAAEMGPGVTNTCGQTSLVELGSLLQEMDLVISVDSGPMHMAAALEVPVLALFGPTDPGRTGPYGEKNVVLKADRPPCWPCRDRSCPACIAAMAGLHPATVTQAALEILRRAF